MLFGKLPNSALPSIQEPPCVLRRYVSDGRTSLLTRTDPMNPRTNQNNPEYSIFAITLDAVRTNWMKTEFWLLPSRKYANPRIRRNTRRLAMNRINNPRWVRPYMLDSTISNMLQKPQKHSRRFHPSRRNMSSKNQTRQEISMTVSKFKHKSIFHIQLFMGLLDCASIPTQITDAIIVAHTTPLNHFVFIHHSVFLC